MEEIAKQIADLQTALEQQQSAMITERRLARTERRLAATWSCAFVGIVGAFVLGLSPEARAQFGVTLTSLNNRLTAVETKTRFVTVSGGEMFVTGTNLHIRSGSGATNGNPADPFSTTTTAVNGLGNLIVGYNEVFATFGNERTGSHNIVIGTGHEYTSFGGVVAGFYNSISAPYATVTGGNNNYASGLYTTVTGGATNNASGYCATVTGGNENTAFGVSSSVTGGQSNEAGASFSAVSGGFNRDIGRGDFTPPNAYDWRAGDLFQDF